MNAIVISGGAGSGKTTLADQLSKMFAKSAGSPPIFLDRLLNLNTFLKKEGHHPSCVVIDEVIVSRDQILNYITKSNNDFPKMPIIIVTQGFLASSRDLIVHQLTKQDLLPF